MTGGGAEFLDICNEETKSAKNCSEENAIFKIYSRGVSTSRDEWVYDYETGKLSEKINYFIDTYNSELPIHRAKVVGRGTKELMNFSSEKIKLTRPVRKDILKNITYSFDEDLIREALYRPFVTSYLYFAKSINEERYQFPSIFPNRDTKNTLIAFDAPSSKNPFSALASDKIVDLHTIGDTQCLPLYRYENGNQLHNITDFALQAFQKHYTDTKIGREHIFHYVYAVLHHPAYREKYALHLKQAFPRIPFYTDFFKWAAWGKELMELHIGFEEVEPYPLERTDKPPKNATPEALALAKKAKLKALKTKEGKYTGVIEIDGLTTLSGVPAAAWEYRLGGRSALEWVLERHKETTPKDPTIRELFNTYRFADHKERVIELLGKVTHVSLETGRILSEMPTETL